MTFQVILERRARTDYGRLASIDRSAFESVLYALGVELPASADKGKPLQYPPLVGQYRWMAHERTYRIIYKIQGNVVRVTRIGPRHSVYR